MHDCDRAILAEIQSDARDYDPRWDGVDEATAMEWERESQRDMIDVEAGIEAWEASREAAWRAMPIDPVPF